MSRSDIQKVIRNNLSRLAPGIIVLFALIALSLAIPIAIIVEPYFQNIEQIQLVTAFISAVLYISLILVYSLSTKYQRNLLSIQEDQSDIQNQQSEIQRNQTEILEKEHQAEY